MMNMRPPAGIGASERLTAIAAAATANFTPPLDLKFLMPACSPRCRNLKMVALVDAARANQFPVRIA